MTHEQKLSEVREAVVRACPDVMELKFGCEVRMLADGWIRCVVIRTKNPCTCKKRDACKVCGNKPSMVRLQGVDNFAADSSYTNWLYTEDLDMVIGRHITLDDCAQVPGVDKHALIDAWKHGNLDVQNNVVINILHSAL